MKNSSRFLLVDINSYFATLAQQENPALRGRPVVIVKDLGRTCVIAASKEAKKLGIKTGTNLHQAKRLAPDLIQIGAEFELYMSATKKLSTIFKQISPQVQVYSLDEAFIDVSSCRQHLYPNLHQLGRKIQGQIRQQLGEWVTANVGIAKNRFLAKMAAEVAKKGSVFEINAENLDEVLASVEFADVCGIGLRLGKKLAKLGVTHPYQIRFYSLSDLEPVFGPFWSRELLKMAYGQEPHHLALLDQADSAGQRMKSVSRSITTWEKVGDLQAIRRIIRNLTREVIYKARRMKMSGRHLGLYLLGSDRACWRKRVTFKHALSHTQELMEVFNGWLDKDWQSEFAPIKFVVVLSLLQPNQELATSLLPSWHKRESLEQAIDEIDDRYGLHTVRSGLLHSNKQIIQPEVTGFLGDKDYQFNYR